MEFDKALLEQGMDIHPCNYFVPTLNKTGFMTKTLDPISLAFVNYAARCGGKALEIGTAYGVAALKALSGGATLVCNDLDSRHLKILAQQVKEKDRARLELVPGKFPDDLSFSDNTFKAILIARVLHFFDGRTLEVAIEKLYRSLIPGGKLFLVVDTPYLKNLGTFSQEYENRVQQGMQWPGEIIDLKSYVNNRDDKWPDFVHVFDLKVISETIARHDFIIEKAGYMQRNDYPEDRRLDGRESVGLIATKVCNPSVD